MYLDGVEFVDSWSEVVWISSERDLELCQELVHSSQQSLWPVSHTIFMKLKMQMNTHRVKSIKHSRVLCVFLRVGTGVFGGNAIEHNDSVCQICGHDKVVLHHKSRFLCVQNESVKREKKKKNW